MFQVIAMWNLVRPDQEIENAVRDIELRGYNPETFLTGEFATSVARKEIQSLSVSDIVYRRCPTRRDLYFLKGRNRLSSRERKIYEKKFWWNYAGNFVENHIINTFQNNYTKKNRRNYSGIIKKASNVHRNITNTHNSLLESLKTSESESYGINVGDTDWLLVRLDKNARAEIVLKLLHSILKEETSLSFENIEPITPFARTAAAHVSLSKSGLLPR